MRLSEFDSDSLHIAGLPAATRVVVAMSGGVDSSVVAGLLKHLGYDVVGITLQLYDHGRASARKGACCAGQDIHDAGDVARRLAIPHYVLDYEERFAKSVISAFVDSYAAGETPVPCAACNSRVKFRDLLATARELGASALVTGHYVASRPQADGHMALHRPADGDRDQSYFLYETSQAQLDLLRFPLGELDKPQVRDLARELGLAVADKADSQDICFVPSGRYTSVIERLRPDASEPGDIVHVDGRLLGRHNGIIHFTVGQRKGLGVVTGEPLFVVRLDAGSRRVTVGPRAALAVGVLRLRNVNWLGSERLADVGGSSIDVAVRVRSTRPPQPARLGCVDGEVVVTLAGGDSGVSPGQACVFYADEGPRARVLGGGTIAATAASDAVVDDRRVSAELAAVS